MEIALISMFSDNTQYEIKEPLNLKFTGGDERKILNGTYALRELSAFAERKMIISNLNNDPQVIKTDKFAKITEMVLNLNELDNSDSLEDGRPSNALLTYDVSNYKEFTSFDPHTSQYKKLKNDEFVSLTLRITDQNGNIITNGPGTTVVLHIR